MKKYLCDLCGNEFAPEDGMTKGWWTGSRLAKWQNPGGDLYEIKINKTMKITRDVPATDGIPAHEIEMEMDLCRSCIIKFERP